MKDYICLNCDEEFEVKSLYETESKISFCPFCGEDIEEDDEDDDENLDDEDYRD